MAMIYAASLPARLSLNHLIVRNKLLTNKSLVSAVVGPQIQWRSNRNISFQNVLTPDDERVYLGTLAPRMRAVKLFSLLTSLTGLAIQPTLLKQGMELGGTGMAVALCTLAGFFTFVTPLLLHIITKKYVTELHYNPHTDEYTATTVSILLYKIYTKFKVSDVNVPDVPGMFTSFKVRGKPLFVEPSLFSDTEHYVKIMGLDKPVDFKLEMPTKEDEETNKKKGIEIPDSRQDRNK